ncbi:MAG: FkbM family methyltransferase [Deltaproteobacteria bacterium]|nr:FkbM family methyltransferase [Deltaproteobacteria bacterium]
MSRYFQFNDLLRTNPGLANFFLWAYETWGGADSDDIYIHLGCGDKVLDGFINLDFLPVTEDVTECHLLNIWPESLFDKVKAFYAEDVIEHFFLSEQLYILCSMNCLLGEEGLVRLLMPDISQLWTYGRRFDLDHLQRKSDYFVTTMRCRNGMDAVNMGMRMGGHRWLHDFTSFQRVAEACGFSASRTTCTVSSDPKMTDINVRDESGISFAVELRRSRHLSRLLVEPEQVRNSEFVEDLGNGQFLYRATNDDPGISYSFNELEVKNIALANVRSANISELCEHNFGKAYFMPNEKGAIYVDRTLHSSPHMNAFSEIDIATAMRNESSLKRLRFDPSERTGDYFTVGPMELFVFDPQDNEKPFLPKEQINPVGDFSGARMSENNGDIVDHNGGIAKRKLADGLESHVITSKCRYGMMSYFDFDGPIGLSLALYGEWAQKELEVIEPFVSKGSTVVDVGANIGTHAMAFAAMVGHTGSVVALEPQEELYTLLTRNSANNVFGRVIRTIRAGVAAGPGQGLIQRIIDTDGQNLGAKRMTPCSADTRPSDEHSLVDFLTIDGLNLNRLDFLKIDVEGDEKRVLIGAEKTIRSLRPVVCCESGGFVRSWPPLKMMLSWGYAAFYVRTSAFNDNNYLLRKNNVFDDAEEGHLLFLPEEQLLASKVPVPKMPAYRILNAVDFARALLGMDTYTPLKASPNKVSEHCSSAQLDECLLMLRCKRAEERCVEANKSVKNLHRKAKSLRKMLSEVYEAMDKPDSIREQIVTLLGETMPALPEIDEPDICEPWPSPPEMEDWLNLAHQRRAQKNSRGGIEKDLVDVIVPVYRGMDQTLSCLYSVLSAPTTTPFHLVVVDDASPEPELSATLRYLADLHLFTLISHSKNRGFVISANEGMRLNPDRDVLLLNSDTVVYNNWLDRLHGYAKSNADVGTVTPLSNNATICSYPVVERNNRAGLEISFAELDALSGEINSGVGVTIPTGIGFCMYIRRECMDAVGLFNEEAFGRGYGEENDFCMRATAAGWRNVLLPSVFVRHAGASSFEEQAFERMDAGLDAVKRLHPTYEDIVLEYCVADKSRDARRALDLARLRRLFQGEGQAILMVTHAWGGGVERHVMDLCDRLIRENSRVLLLRPYSKKSMCVWGLNLPEALHLPNLSFDLPQQFGELLEVLATLDIGHIHVHNFAGFQHAAPDVIRLVAELLGVDYDFTVHDYISLCPNTHLVDQNGLPCEGAMLWQCRTCVEGKLPPLLGRTDIEHWRERYRRFLCGARRIFAPSSDTAHRISAIFPQCSENIEVRPHPEACLDPSDILVSSESREENLAVAVVGAIGPHKGSRLLLECARDAKRRDLPISFKVIGYTSEDEELERVGVSITGAYQDSELVRLLNEARCSLAFFPAIWPETYSYTLSEAARAGLFPVAFDLGAPAERIREWGWGQLLPEALKWDAIAVNDALLSCEPVPLPDGLLEQLFRPNHYDSNFMEKYYNFGEGHPVLSMSKVIGPPECYS